MSDARRDVLGAVRDQAKLLGAEPSSSGVVWTAQQWWQAFAFLFVQSPTPCAEAQHQDDLLFFVRAGGGQQTAQEGGLFVRRKAKSGLPPELQLSGAEFAGVDWARSVLLNLVLQQQYQLTVVACGREGLPFVAEGRTWGAGMVAVTHAVFATTSQTPVNLDSNRAPKAAAPRSSYPDICFAVDNFDNAYEDQVLEHLDQCYCVVLQAILDTAAEQGPAAPQPHPSLGLDRAGARLASHGAASSSGGGGPQPPAPGPAGAPGAQQQQQQQQLQQQQTSNDGSASGWQIGTRKHTLFAGFVSFKQVLDFMASGGSSSSTRSGAPSLLQALLSGGAAAPGQQQRDKVVMTGPGGVGRCEVAVTKVVQPDSQPQQLGQHPGQQQGRSLFARGLQRARQVATDVQAALSDSPSAEGGSPGCRMVCALMLIRLPVTYLAQQLLGAV